MVSQNGIVAAFYFIAIPYKSIARRVYVTCFLILNFWQQTNVISYRRSMSTVKLNW